MVDAGHLIPHKIGDVAAVLLGVHADDIVLLRHIGAQPGVGEHLDVEGIQHPGGAQLVDPAVIAQGGARLIPVQQALQAEGGGDGVRVGEVVGLDIDMFSAAQGGQLVKVAHGASSLLFLYSRVSCSSPRSSSLRRAPAMGRERAR